VVRTTPGDLERRGILLGRVGEPLAPMQQSAEVQSGDVVARLEHLAYVVEVGPHPQQQAAGADAFGGRFGHRGDVDRMVVGPGGAAHEFLSTAVREHNENEELALFSVLGDEAPTEPFVEDHVAIRAMERRLLAAIEARDPTETAAAGLAIVDVLRDHIDREDNALFPMARELLGPEGLLEVSRRLEG